MATARTHDFTFDVAQRLAIVERLLTANPMCAVGVVDSSRNVGDGAPTLADLGISAVNHPKLEASALVEFVAVADVWLLSEVAREAKIRGAATRSLRLRSGEIADLHLIALSDTEPTVAAIIVHGAVGGIIERLTPTAVPASPRVGIVHCDDFGVITSASPAALVLLAGVTTSIVGALVITLVHPADQEMAIVNWVAAKEQRHTPLRWRLRFTRPDGSALWTETTITNDVDADGRGSVQLELYDVSLEVAATDAFLAERELIGLLTETLPVGVAKFDATGCVEHTNDRLSELLAPLDPHHLLGQAASGELDDLDLAAAFNRLFQFGEATRIVVEHATFDGTIRHLEWTIRAATGPAGDIAGGVLCLADVTQATQARETLEVQATTDTLTGCLNRAGAVAELERGLANVGHCDGLGVLFIDVDDLKGINDTRGHPVGDAVLQLVAARLRRRLRHGDSIGRLGGDEFIVILPGLRSASATLTLATRISADLQGEALISDVPVSITASIGVAWAASGTVNELISAADAAMYVAKHNRFTKTVLSGATTADEGRPPAVRHRHRTHMTL